MTALSIRHKLMLSHVIIAIVTAIVMYLILRVTPDNRTLDTSLLAICISIVAMLPISALITHFTLRPLYTLIDATSAIANGDSQQNIPVQSQDELGQLAQHFNIMNRKIVHANQRHRQMTADIAHDLGTPLQIIAGYIETMQDGTLSATPERIKIIADEIELLRRLTNDLDILARFDAKTLSLNLETIDTHDYLTQIVTRFRPIAHQQNISLNLIDTPTTPLPPVHADHDRLTQVMCNLIENALRYTPADGSIQLSVQPAQKNIQLCIRDTGTGIAPTDLPFIFNRFYQVNQNRDDGGKMGLGLAISQALIEAMSGQITVESPGRNQGTTFTITLPRK